MTLITVLYIVLLLVFGLFAAFILRHNARYGYLSPHFRIILSIFGLMGLALILFSLFLLLQLYKGPSLGAPFPPPPSNTSTQSDLNF